MRYKISVEECPNLVDSVPVRIANACSPDGRLSVTVFCLLKNFVLMKFQPLVQVLICTRIFRERSHGEIFDQEAFQM